MGGREVEREERKGEGRKERGKEGRQAAGRQKGIQKKLCPADISGHKNLILSF